MKELHTALFIAPTGVEKTHLALSLLETEYRNHFDFIVIICPTLRYNSTYKNRSWVWNDPDVIPKEPGNQLYYLIEKISDLLAGDKTLFLTEDIIADETLDKRRQPLLELAISGRYRGHSLWLSLPGQSLSELDNFYQNDPERNWYTSSQHWCCQNGIRYFPTEFLTRATNVTMTAFRSF